MSRVLSAHCFEKLHFLLQHVVKSPSNGFIHGLQVVPGQQVSDGSVLFTVKVSHRFIADHVIVTKYSYVIQKTTELLILNIYLY